MGFPNYSSPGTFNIQVEGDNEPEEAMRPSRGEVDPMSIMMAQIARQNKEGTIVSLIVDWSIDLIDLIDWWLKLLIGWFRWSFLIGWWLTACATVC